MPNEEEIKKDAALKEKIKQQKQEELLNLQMDTNNKARQDQIKRELRAARGLEYNAKEDKVEPGTAQKLEQAIEQLSSMELKTYIEWGTAMAEIFNGCVALRDDSATTGLGFFWTETLGRTHIGQGIQQGAGELIDIAGNKIKSVASTVVEKVDINVLNKTLDYLGIKDNFHNQFNCYFKPDVDENGKLATKGMYKGRVMSDEQKNILTTGFIKWAKLRGCEYDETTEILKDESGNIMTSEHLQEINKDDENGFTAYVRQAYDVELQDKYKNRVDNSPSSTPVPRPY